MNTVTFLIIASVLATFGVLVAGGVSMVRGGEYDREHSVEFMEGRVIMQAIALVLVVLAAVML
mgnify:CR=1 FL=1